MKRFARNGKGKLLVIDGTDGSGKHTQVGLLKKRLASEGHTVKIVDFPEYYKNFFGAFIGHCLTERYYDWINVHPKIASIAYAADRWESSARIKKWLSRGFVVIANRYVSANQIHQGGKIPNAKRRADFLRWLDKMEYQIFGIPRPDVVLYLSLPLKIILGLLKNRESSKMKRIYLRKKKDIYEQDVNFQKNARRSALWLADKMKNFVKIECAERGKILSREIIHQKIYREVKRFLKK